MIDTFKKLMALVLLLIVVALGLLWIGWPILVVSLFMPSPMWVFDILAILWAMFWVIHVTKGNGEAPNWMLTLLTWCLGE